MTISVYLDRYVVDVIECYGTLDEVVNKMLDAADGGEFDVFDKPSAGIRTEDSVRVDIDIRNESYLMLMSTFSPNSPRISLRRFVHWFIDNEMPQRLGWEAVNEYGKKYKDKAARFLGKAEYSISKAKYYLDALGDFTCSDALDKILHDVVSIRSKL